MKKRSRQGGKMARRSVLPPHVQAELPRRAQYGVGHDMNAGTLYFGEQITAFEARQKDPSPEMSAVIKSIWGWIEDKGGTSIGVLVDIRHAKHPGCVTIQWSKGPTARQVAEQFAVKYVEDGTPERLPQIPGWISLKNEDDWDLRWQPTYGDILPNQNPLFLRAVDSEETPESNDKVAVAPAVTVAERKTTGTGAKRGRPRRIPLPADQGTLFE